MAENEDKYNFPYTTQLYQHLISTIQMNNIISVIINIINKEVR